MKATAPTTSFILILQGINGKANGRQVSDCILILFKLKTIQKTLIQKASSFF